MSETNSKIYVCEWDKQAESEDYTLKVTPHESTETALQQAQNSTANQHCISTVNPVEEGEKK